MTDLDPRDRAILTGLQRDCRMPNAELAAQAGVSASACWRRVRALEQSGVITGYGARIDPARAGLQFHAMVHVHLTRHDPEKIVQFIAAIETCDAVQECYATTGQADYHLRVLCRDLDAYNRFLETFLFRLPAVDSAQTNVILRSVKSSGPVAL
ncbi:MAG: Lrp/AsnC family transcriptional regulator [Rhodobacteraceae bacterium]|nr:Lrp/AsnC family transcriptional regulator [Paracoccaceae bacterium]